MASMIYGVSRNKKKGLGYSESYRKNKTLIAKPKSLYEQSVPSGIKVRSSNPAHSEGSRRQPQKRNKSLRIKPHAQKSLDHSEVPKVSKTSEKKTNKKGLRKWVLKNKI